MNGAGATLLTVVVWFAAIAFGIWVFWRVARVATGLSRSSDPGVPLFDSETLPTETFFARLEGTEGVNPDGTARQELLRHCVVGEPLRLELQAAIRDLPERVEVSAGAGSPLGWLDASSSHIVASCLHKGRRAEAAVADVTGRIGLPWGRTLTVKVTMEMVPRTTPSWDGVPPSFG